MLVGDKIISVGHDCLREKKKKEIEYDRIR